MRTLTLSYTPESDDIAELAVNSPELRRSRNRAPVNSGVSLVLTVIFGTIWASDTDQFDAFVIASFCAAMFVSYTYRAVALRARWGLRRRARGVWRRSPTLWQPYEAVIGEESLTVRTEGVTHTYAWSTFGELVEYDRQFALVERSGRTRVALPKRGLPDPSLVPVCRSLLMDRLAAAAQRRETESEAETTASIDT